MLKTKQLFLEAHNGISALLIEKSKRKIDGIWVSSLTSSAVKGLPDTELLSLEDRVNLVAEIRRVSKKPILVDIDTGGDERNLPYYVDWFEKAGAWGVVMEDKKYPKQNSLLEGASHKLEEVDIFCEKIKKAKKKAKNLKIIARLESLIAKRSVYEALIRADAYQEAGADAILIHSKSKVSADEVMEFARKFREKSKLPLVAIPTTYTLPKDNPFDIIILANQMFRASFRAMKDYLEGKNNNLADVEEIFKITNQC